MLHGEDSFIIQISFFKVNKELEKRKNSTCLELRAYTQDSDSCVLTCLEKYLKGPTHGVRKGRVNCYILSHLKPHKEIQKSSLAGWVKIVLRKAGIDTSQFKAH